MRVMETPPQYAPPRKKSNTGLIIGLILGGIGICCIGGIAVMIFGVGWFFKNVSPMAECMLNYEVVRESMTTYANEHDGKLPSAATWQDELAPYVQRASEQYNKKSNPFKTMSAGGEWGCTSGDTHTGMAFNDKFNGKKLADARLDDGVIVFETEKTGRNLHDAYAPRDRSTSPKMLGKPRGWFTLVGASGVQLDGQSAGMNMHLNK